MLSQGVGTERDRLAAEIKLASERVEYQARSGDRALRGCWSGGGVVLRSPSIDGVVLSRRATVGAAVTAGGSAGRSW